MEKLIHYYNYPGFLVRGIWTEFIRKEKSYDFSEINNFSWIISSLFWIVISLFIYRELFYEKITYVYACQRTVCFKVLADYSPEYCESEHDGRGGGREYCTPAHINSIYLTDGKRISFDTCNKNKKIFTCSSSNSDTVWDIEIAERVWVRK